MIPSTLLEYFSPLRRANRFSTSSLFLSSFWMIVWGIAFFSPARTSTWFSIFTTSGYANSSSCLTFCYRAWMLILTERSTVLMGLYLIFCLFEVRLGSSPGSSSFSCLTYRMSLNTSCLSWSDRIYLVMMFYSSCSRASGSAVLRCWWGVWK